MSAETLRVTETPPLARGRFQEALKISLPITASQFMVMMGGFISNLMLSRVDAASFAAGLLVNSIQLALATVVFGSLYSLSPLIGKVVGEGRDPERVGQFFMAGCVVVLVMAVPTMITLYNIKPILLALEQPIAVVDPCERYFRLYVWVVPAVGLLSVYIQFLLATFKQTIVLLYSTCSVILLTVLGYVMVFGKLGLPALGIEGLARASVVTTLLAFVLLTWFVLGRREHRKFELLAFQPKVLPSAIGSTLRIGLPICVQMGNEVGSFFVSTIMIGWMGIEALAAQQVAVRYAMMLIIPVIGLSQAATLVVSRSFGAKNAADVKQYGGFYTSMGLAYSSLVLIAFLLAPRIFIEVFLAHTPENARLFAVLPTILVLLAIGQIFDAVRNIVTGALRGLQDTRYPMYLSILMIWPIGLPLGYCMGFTWHWGLTGLTVANDIILATGCGIVLLRWRAKLAGLVDNFETRGK